MQRQMSSGWLVSLIAVTVCVVAGCKNKIADGEADGARIYTDACSPCHGSMGRPSPSMAMQYGVPDLTTGEFHNRATSENVRERVANGSSKKGMPAFRSSLTDEQLDAIAAFVLTFGR